MPNVLAEYFMNLNASGSFLSEVECVIRCYSIIFAREKLIKSIILCIEQELAATCAWRMKGWL